MVLQAAPWLVIETRPSLLITNWVAPEGITEASIFTTSFFASFKSNRHFSLIVKMPILMSAAFLVAASGHMLSFTGLSSKIIFTG